MVVGLDARGLFRVWFLDGRVVEWYDGVRGGGRLGVCGWYQCGFG